VEVGKLADPGLNNVKNWDYVMLSHVRTRNGLFLREAISRRGLDRPLRRATHSAKNDG
jgi:hypothetical protein